MKRFWMAIFMILSLALLTSSSWAATYYVATSGNNANPGTQASPWATISYAATRARGGDTILVRGGTYAPAWIGNGGTAQGPVSIKAYPGETPVINGGLVTFTSHGAYSPVGIDLANGASYVTIEGFEIKNAAVGINVTSLHDVTIKNCKIYHILHNGITVQYSYNVLVEGNEVFDTANDWHFNVFGQWGGGIAATGSSHDITFRKNIVHDVQGEGIISFWGNYNILIEHNVSYNNWGAEFYIDANRNATVRYNMAYGTNDTSKWRVGAPSSGIIINNEQPHNYPHQYSNHLIYGNVCAYNRYNFAVWGGESSTPYSGMKVFNNTFVEASVGAIQMDKTFNAAEFKNNIIWQTKGTMVQTVGQSLSGMQFDYNLWSRDPGAAFRGAHDPAWAVPNLAKSSGWTSLTPGSLNGSEFALQPGSPAIDRGCNLGSTYGSTAELNTSNFTGRNLTLISQDGQGAGWEIGADVSLSGGGAPSLSAPKGLQVAGVQ